MNIALVSIVFEFIFLKFIELAVSNFLKTPDSLWFTIVCKID